MIKLFQVPEHIVEYCEAILRKSQLDWRYETSTLVGEARTTANKTFPTGSSIDNLKIEDTYSLTLMLYDGLTNYKNQNYKRFTPLHKYVLETFSPEDKKFTRVLMNLQLRSQSPDLLINYPHVDSKDDSYYSLLYYLVDSDGPTYFFKNGKIAHAIEPKKGTAVLFKSNILHAGAKPRIYNDRVAVNYMFKLSQKDISAAENINK